MKNLFLLLSILFTFALGILHAPEAFATGTGAIPVRQMGVPSIYNYTTLIASTVKGTSGIQVNNTGIHPIEIAFGAVGQEIPQILVGGFQDTAFIPFAGGYGNRISVIALDGPNETGEIDLNIVYN